jgi:hypothetical protein
MKSEQPPRLAMWLLKYFGCSDKNDALIGDLVERHQQGKGSVWFWKEVLVAIVTGFVEDAFGHKWLMFRAMYGGLGGFLLLRLAVEILYVKWLGSVAYRVGIVLFLIILCSAIAGQIAARMGGGRRSAVFSFASVSLILFIVADGVPSGWYSAAISALNFLAMLVSGFWGVRRSAQSIQPE